ncbi:peptidoglycan-binding domain-containing protein 1 [Favolaschia claudopus]|uniref:Peptidoglycan-binding domain-containing protein 1 n=1 Tax=Favolaschia claudopus TaxID=2862362 RepID=A0AAW0AAY7_9AGAR
MSPSNGFKPGTPESVYFNPFAEERQSTTAVDVSFISGRSNRPVIRRRGSGSESTTASSASSSSGLSVFTSSPYNSNGKSDGHLIEPLSSGAHHPLRSADLSSGFRFGAGVTRPHLNRIVDIPPLVDAPPVPGADMIVAEPAPDEKVVLVHEVTPVDSLAGVALKYGISLAELRRANHLWASDPIHLRKVLYIPLDKTSRREPPSLLVSTEDMDQSARSATSPTQATTPLSTIRRVPASQLSFFPPPARPQLEELNLPIADAPPAPTKHSHSRHVRYATTPTSYSPVPGTAGSPSLASILSALPIQPSTRDTIIARLSYDNSPGSTSFTDDEGHELDDVRRGASLDSIFPSNEATPKAKPPVVPPAASNRSHNRTASASSIYGGGGAQYRRAGPPRTVQLEPSPVMQLPFGTLRRKRVESEHVNGDFDLLGLRNGEGEGDTEDLGP